MSLDMGLALWAMRRSGSSLTADARGYSLRVGAQ